MMQASSTPSASRLGTPMTRPRSRAAGLSHTRLRGVATRPSQQPDGPPAALGRTTDERPEVSDRVLLELASLRDACCVAPLGRWRTTLDDQIGWGFDGTGLYGSAIEFRPDGTDLFESWCALQGRETVMFRWSSVGPFCVSIANDQLDDLEPEIVPYEFYVAESGWEVCLRQTDHVGGVGFWFVYGPLVRVGGRPGRTPASTAR